MGEVSNLSCCCLTNTLFFGIRSLPWRWKCGAETTRGAIHRPSLLPSRAFDGG